MTDTKLISARDDWYFSPFAFIVAMVSYLLSIGGAVALAAHDVAVAHGPHDPTLDQTRAQRTAQATLVLLTVAICLYLLWYRGGTFKRFWRWLWTFAYVAFVTHLWFAFCGVFHGNVAAVFHSPELVTHPRPDTLLAIWWGFDVVLAWIRNPESEDIGLRIERGLAHVIFPTAFYMATHETKATPSAHTLGNVMVAVLVAAVLFWIGVRRPVPQAR